MRGRGAAAPAQGEAEAPRAREAWCAVRGAAAEGGGMHARVRKGGAPGVQGATSLGGVAAHQRDVGDGRAGGAAQPRRRAAAERSLLVVGGGREIAVNLWAARGELVRPHAPKLWAHEVVSLERPGLLSTRCAAKKPRWRGSVSLNQKASMVFSTSSVITSAVNPYLSLYL